MPGVRVDGGRPVSRQDVVGASLGNDPPGFQQEQPGSQCKGFRRAMRDIEHGDGQGLLGISQSFEQGVPVGEVEGGNRLIAEQQVRTGSECPREPDALWARRRRASPDFGAAASRRRKVLPPRQAAGAALAFAL